MWAIDHDLEQATTGWNFSPRLSSVHGIDDPFHQDQPSKDPGHVHDLDLQWHWGCPTIVLVLFAQTGTITDFAEADTLSTRWHIN